MCSLSAISAKLRPMQQLLRTQCRTVKNPPTPPSSMMHLVLGLLGTAEETRSPGSNETGLLTLCSVAGDGRGLTNMLVVTTTVRL